MPILALLASPRRAIVAVFVAFGTCIGAWAGAIPAVARNADIGNFTLGIGITAFTAVYVAAMALSGRLARHTGNRSAMLLTIPLAALATLILMSSGSPFVFFAGLALFGASLGSLDVIMNAEGSAIERDVGRPIFVTFHGAASSGMAVLAIVSSLISVTIGPWGPALIAAACLALAWLATYRHVPVRPPAGVAQSAGEARSHRTPLLIMGLAAGLVIATETAAVMWSAKLLDERAPLLAAFSGLGAAFYGLCNAALRFQADGLRHRFGDLPLMMASLLAAILGFAALGLSRDFAVSVAAFALVGLGTAPLIPCIFALAAGRIPENRAAAIGFVSGVAGLPRTLAPWLFGWIAASVSTSFAFALCTAVLAVALALAVALRGYGPVKSQRSPT